MSGTEGISDLVIGKNPLGKQEINNNKINNQAFVSIPHARFIQMLVDKGVIKGIEVITREESYTSLIIVYLLSMINVLVVDDQTLTHQLIETYLEPEEDLNIVGFADNGQAAIDQVKSLNPDIVLMDVEMPVMDGLTATEEIVKQFINTKVLILTVHDNEQHLSQALKIGARAYLLKNISAEELAKAIRYVNQGYFQLSLELTEKYLYKIVSSKSEPEATSELEKRLETLSKLVGKTESKFKSWQAKNKQEISKSVEDIVQQQMLLLKDRDSHLQFKVDRMRYSVGRLEQNVKDLFKVQIVCILLASASLLYSLFVNFNF
ncbi:MAG: response regulator [Pleurocapsa sp.]